MRESVAIYRGLADAGRLDAGRARPGGRRRNVAASPPGPRLLRARAGGQRRAGRAIPAAPALRMPRWARPSASHPAPGSRRPPRSAHRAGRWTAGRARISWPLMAMVGVPLMPSARRPPWSARRRRACVGIGEAGGKARHVHARRLRDRREPLGPRSRRCSRRPGWRRPGARSPSSGPGRWRSAAPTAGEPRLVVRAAVAQDRDVVVDDAQRAGNDVLRDQRGLDVQASSWRTPDTGSPRRPRGSRARPAPPIVAPSSSAAGYSIPGSTKVAVAFLPSWPTARNADQQHADDDGADRQVPARQERCAAAAAGRSGVALVARGVVAVMAVRERGGRAATSGSPAACRSGEASRS